MQQAFPTPADDDAEDVAWGLTTGAALWRQGERYDAIVWLKRAVEAANEAGASVRADELNRAATDLIAGLAAPPSAPASTPKAEVALAVASTEPLAPRATPSPPKPPPAPRAPSPPPFRKGPPAPPKAPPPPPPRSRLPSGQTAVAADPFEPPAPRAPLPSVTTSAPTIEALTVHQPPEAVAEGDSREAPPPPTILPDDASTPAMPLAEPDEVTPLLMQVSDMIGDPAPSSPRAAPFDLVPSDAVSAEVAPEEPASDANETTEPEVPTPLMAALAALPFTPAQKKALAAIAMIDELASEEDVSVSCLALVIQGRASAQATVADITAGSLKAGDVLYAKSSIAETLSLRLVAESDATVIAHWDHAADAVLAETPELVETLKRSSNRTQAIAGSSMGLVGERLDDNLRMLALEKLEVRVLAPNEIIAPQGQPVPGMVIIGVGAVDLGGDNGNAERLGPGDFLFATEVLGGGAAPTTARAGSKGAIVLFGGKGVAQELLVTCPPLLEVFAGM